MTTSSPESQSYSNSSEKSSSENSSENSIEALFPGKKWVHSVLDALEAKHAMTSKVFHRYIMRAAMAGMIIAIMYVVNYEVVGVFSQIKIGETDLSAVGKMIGAFCFGWALVFIYYTRSELLTSNMMVVVVGRYYRRTTIGRAARVLFLCFLGNFLGGLLFALLLWSSSLIDGTTGSIMEHAVEVKISYLSSASGVLDLLVRAILCNFMINLAMLLIYNGFIQETLAKMMAMIMSVFIFAFLGFEHSVANTVLFSVVGFSYGIDTVGAILNVIVVLIGNFIGGGLLIGLYYAYLNDNKRYRKS